MTNSQDRSECLFDYGEGGTLRINMDLVRGLVDKDKGDFEKATMMSLVSCAKWLEHNAEELAHEFVGGCRRWSVTFESGDEGMFPEVRISVDKLDMSIIEPYFQTKNLGIYDEHLLDAIVHAKEILPWEDDERQES